MTTQYQKFENNVGALAPVSTVSSYGYPMSQPPTVVQVQPANVGVEKPFGKSWCHFIMNIITLIVGGICCFNPVACIFSILGIVYSSNAYGSHGHQAFEKAKRQSHVSMIFWIISLVSIILFIVIGIICVAVTVSLTADYQTDYYDGSVYLDSWMSSSTKRPYEW